MNIRAQHGINCEPANIDDLPRVIEIYQAASIAAYISPTRPRSRVNEYVTSASLIMSIFNGYSRAINGTSESYERLYVARDPIGNILGFSSTEYDDAGSIVLSGLYTDPGVQRRGVGSEALRTALRPYVGNEISLKTVEGTAEPFYARHGFEINTDATYYNGPEHSPIAFLHGLYLPLVEMVTKSYIPHY